MMKDTSPLVSVILAVLNGENYIKFAIESILSQTYKKFELIVIDDGSTDKTANIIRSFTDPRIKLIQQENRGLSASLNKAIELSNGKYLARQDHDDVSLPTRLEKQVGFMEAHPDYAILGTHSNIWVEDTPSDRGHKHPTNFSSLHFKALFDCFFVHSSVMIRKSVIDLVGPYTLDKNRQPPEDFELWSRIMREFKAANLGEPLLIYRELPGSITRTVNFKEKLIQICSENLAFTAKLDHPNVDTWNISALYHNEPTLLKMPFNFLSIEKLLKQIALTVDKTSPGSNAPEEANILLSQFIGRIPPHLIPSQTICTSTSTSTSNPFSIFLRIKNKLKWCVHKFIHFIKS